MSNELRVNVKTVKRNFKIKNFSFEEAHVVEDPKESIEAKLQEQFTVGFTEGEKSATQRLAAIHDRKLLEEKKVLQQVMQSLDVQVAEYEKQFDSTVVSLAFIIAEKIIKREIEEKSIIRETLQDALKKVLGANKVIIKLNKKDLAAIRENSDSLFQSDGYSKITFETEERIEQGGCLVETEIGNVE